MLYHIGTAYSQTVSIQKVTGRALYKIVSTLDILDMPRQGKDPNRIKDGDSRLNQAQEAASYLVLQRGTRGAASLLEWSMADISRIANGKWKEIRMYPETVEALLFAQAMVSHDESLIAPLRDELKEFSRELGAAVRRAARIRKMISRITR